MSAAIGAIIVLIILLVFFPFVLYLLFHGEHRRLLYIQLAASTILAQVPLAVINQPPIIKDLLQDEPRTEAPSGMAARYCWVRECIGNFTTMIIPLTLMMFTIERLMFVKNPTGHAQKITRAGAITLIAFPWVLSCVLALILGGVILSGVGAEDTKHDNGTAYTICGFPTNQQAYEIMYMILQHVVGGFIPVFINIIVTVCVLVMWCCFKRKMSRGMDYSMMGEEVEATVRNSVIAVAFLNPLFVLIFLFETGAGSITRIDLGFLTLFGVVEGIVWICTLIPVRKRFVALFTRCCQKKSEPLSVQYSSTNTENVTESKLA